MRAPELGKDGWCLEDGEQRNREAPGTFLIPDMELRRTLQPGDFVKLIFKIAAEDQEQASVERMWVIVRERTPNGYVGMLNNEPKTVAMNDRLRLGIEMPFDYRHIISVSQGDDRSTALAKSPVPIPWDRNT